MSKPTSVLSAAKPVRLHVPDFHRVALTLVGCGGTGSHIASGLVAIGQALAERGVALDVLLVDPDIVEPKNVGRQLFAAGDVGKPKAEVVRDRLNAAFGVTVGASPRPVDSLDTFVYPDHDLNLCVGAVDNAAARTVLAQAQRKANGKLWLLDCGNENHSGQIAIGNTCDAKAMRGAVALGMLDRLPSPYLVYPDLLQAPKVKKSRKAQSCAELTAAGEQGLMVNRVVAAWASSMLADFLVTRDLRYFALALDLQWAGARAYTIDAPTLAQALGMQGDQLVAAPKH